MPRAMTRRCASAPACRSRSSPIRRTTSRSRRRTTSGSPRRWRVTCGEPAPTVPAVPHRSGGGCRRRARRGASGPRRADRVPDRVGAWCRCARPRGRGGDAAGVGRRGAGKFSSVDGGRLHAADAPAGPAGGDHALRAAARRGATGAVTEVTKTTQILLVCTGNICRSPLAAALLERALAERAIEGIDISSAGTGAWDGAPVSEGAYLVGLERGLDLSGHRAQLLTREMVDAADLILTMARHHRARVDELGGEGHVFVLGEYAGREGDEAEVSDPFGGDLDVYRDTCVELEALLQTAVERIVKEFASGSQR